ncbi:hypothetical protein COJ30_30200 [Bacillus anthracis]|uniref:Uncharacterized protein n=1 Tax=Bacillus anthracis TaxID=1392 RepID=A0A2B0W895_BACAN|nr:hypothetical protein COJ30_30200 [Bacillus anthracis]
MSFSLLLKVHPFIVIYYILFILFLQVLKNIFYLIKKKPKIDFWFPLLNFTNLVVRNLSPKIDVASLSSLNLSTVQPVNYSTQYS